MALSLPITTGVNFPHVSGKSSRGARWSPLLMGVCLVLLASCGNSSYHFKLEGVSGEFCVPKTGYVAPGVWFAPEDSSDASQGFSFGGCHRVRQSDRENCTLPKEFISADVDPLSAGRSSRWRDLKASADYRLVVGKPGVKYSIDQGTGMLVLFNEVVPKEWSVWRRDTHADALPLAMHDGDELIVSCAEVGNFSAGADGLGVKGEYGCERYVVGDRYALTYRFISKRRVPSENELKAFDVSLFDQVDRWHCSSR